MDPRLLRYYNRELQYIREMGAEFAKEFPKIAGRLGLEGFECADPYVERLLEGFGFLAARVQLKIDAEFPRFTQHLLQMVYPHYLTPTPSMAVVEFQPDLTEGSMAEGFIVPRNSTLRSLQAKDQKTACEYRTAHPVTLLPIELVEGEYFTHARDLDIPGAREFKAAIRLQLKAGAGMTFDKIALDGLTLHLRGADEQPMRLYEQLLANATAVVVRPGSGGWKEVLDARCIGRVGFTDDEALLPYGPRSFHGYRLLQEYFAFSSRYMFVELRGLGAAARRCVEDRLEIVILLDRNDPVLQGAIGESNFGLFSTPAINLFPKKLDRIHLTDRQNEYHAVPDRTRPMDFEIYQVTEVVGYGTGADTTQEFLPFYASRDVNREASDRAYFAVDRTPRILSDKQRRKGARSSYIGSEMRISLVDASEAPYSTDLRQLAVSGLCTNRDLPLHMPVGAGNTDFTLEAGAPVKSIRCVAGPSMPKPSHAEGEMAWRLISHLSLNYLSLMDDEKQGAAALRELLGLYGDSSEVTIRNQIDGVRSVVSRPVIRRLPVPGSTSFGRGLEVSVTFDEGAFEGTGVFLLGAVLEQFFAKYVSINSFTETSIHTIERGEIKRWPVREGRRHQV